MDKDKLNEVEILIDGIEFDIREIWVFVTRLEEKIKDLRGLLQDKKEEF